jgi:hypothetical protein
MNLLLFDLQSLSFTLFTLGIQALLFYFGLLLQHLLITPLFLVLLINS